MKIDIREIDSPINYPFNFDVLFQIFIIISGIPN